MTPEEEIEVATRDLQKKLGDDAVAMWQRIFPLFQVAGMQKGAATLAALTMFDVAIQLAQQSIEPSERVAFRHFMHARLDLVMTGQSDVKMAINGLKLLNTPSNDA